MARVPRRPRRPDRDDLFAHIEPVAAQDQAPYTEPALAQRGHEIGEQVGNDLFDRLRRADRLEQRPPRLGHFEGNDRHDRFGHEPARLIEPLDRSTAEAPGQRPARHRVEIGDPLDPEPGCGGERFRREPERRQRQRCERLSFPPFRQDCSRPPAIARERVSGAGCPGDRDTRGEAEALQKAEQPRCKALLAAKEMRRPG